MQSDSTFGICLRAALHLQPVKTRKGLPSFFLILLCIFYVGFRTRPRNGLDWKESIEDKNCSFGSSEGLASHIFLARLGGGDEIRNLSCTSGTSSLPNQLLPVVYVATPHAFASSTSTTLATLKSCFTHASCSISHICRWV